MTAAHSTPLSAAYQARVDRALDHFLPPDTEPPQRLHAALRYAVLGAGKRVRPLLCYVTGEACGVPVEQLDAAATALEFIHAYSLVHDDLPAMDDDDLRRGRPTTHRAFDEATAILAGDALQVLAFEILAGDDGVPPTAGARLAMIRVLADASGTRGMAGGQALDLAAVGGMLDVPAIEDMHSRKTGALIRAAVLMAASARPDLPPERYAALDTFGSAIGLAFQIVDDLLDLEGDEAVVGKPVGADGAKAKPTHPRVAGAAASHARADALLATALGALEVFGPEADGLRALARFIVARPS